MPGIFHRLVRLLAEDPARDLTPALVITWQLSRRVDRARIRLVRRLPSANVAAVGHRRRPLVLKAPIVVGKSAGAGWRAPTC